MTRDVLDVANGLMIRRQFDKAVRLLEGKSQTYEHNFDYYLLLATANLYLGNTGQASVYFQKARNIKLTDKNLLLGQAALFLRRGDTSRALTYYLEILENDPGNKIATEAMDFIRYKGDFNTICRWVDTGRIEQFYPPLGVNIYRVAGIVFPVVACLLGVVMAFSVMGKNRPVSEKRADLSSLVLSVSERQNLQERDMSPGSFAYILTAGQINDSYEKAQMYFQNYRDNMAQVEINRILNSNASVFVKQKMNLLMGYLEEPGFDTIKDSPTYKQVQGESRLYLDCWVAWSGRISNVRQTETQYSCDLLVGYDNMSTLEGIVPVHFSVVPVIENEKPVKILGKIKSVDGKLSLEGRAVYQSVK